MKKVSISLMLVAGMLCFGTKHAKAQNSKGETVVSAGVGYSIIFGLLSSLGTSSAYVDGGTNTSSSIPEINATGDYAIIDHFSLGLGVGYQSAKFSDNGFIDAQDTGATLYNSSLVISRLNIGIRPIYHFTDNPNLDFYMGLRLGVSIWHYGITSNDPYYDFSAKFNGALPSFQYLIGLKGYFTPVIGAHIEAALGTPYLIEGGVSFKFGGASK